MIGIYRNGKLRKSYADAGKAAIALAMAKDIQPECQWELKEVPQDDHIKCQNESERS